MNYIKKISLLLYALLIFSSVGYYSMKVENDKFAYYWIAIFVVSLVALLLNNHYLFQQYRTKLVYFDMLFILWVLLVPMISLPFGVARLIMALVGMTYAIVMNRKKLACK